MFYYMFSYITCTDIFLFCESIVLLIRTFVFHWRNHLQYQKRFFGLLFVQRHWPILFIPRDLLFKRILNSDVEMLRVLGISTDASVTFL